jgi:hypothetical protein
MATVDKNFKVKHGLIVEGTTATVNGEDILTTGSTTSDLAEGTNLYFTEQRAVDAVTDEINTAVEDAIDAITTDVIEEGATNLYFTNQRALDATASAYDVAGTAAAAQTAAEDYADGLAGNYDPAGSASTVQTNLDNHANDTSTHGVTEIVGTSETQTLTNKTIDSGSNTITVTSSNVSDFNTAALSATASAYDAAGAAATAEGNANVYTDTALESYTTTAGLDTAIDGLGYLKDADLSGYATETYVNSQGFITSSALTGYATETYVGDAVTDAIADVVGLAPAALDTLQELAAAFNDEPDTLQNLITEVNGKQDALTAGTGIDITGDTISVAANTYDAYGAAATAEQNANDYTDTAVGTKQDTLTAGAGIDITGDTISAKYAAFSGAIGTTSGGNLEVKVDDTSIWTGGSSNQLMVKTGVGSPVASKTYADDAADAAEQNAKDYADANFVSISDLPGELDDYVLLTEKGAFDGVATLDGTGNVPVEQLGNVPSLTLGAGETNLDVTDGELTLTATPSFTSVELNSIAKQVAATSSSLGSVPVTAFEFAKADYRTAKFLVKIDNESDNEVSEVLITLDSADNIAITEYAIVGTNGSRGEITADINGSNVRLRVNPVNDSTINVVGTLLA